MNTVPSPRTPPTPPAVAAPLPTTTSTNSPPVLPSGHLMLNRWRIGSKLGQGAFGQTIEAHDLILNKRVAIKFETGSAAKQVLKLEISILKRLHECPYSAQFFGSGCMEIGQPPTPQTYMVMELLGTNLSDIRKNQPGNQFSVHTTALLARQMIQALRWVHQSGYLHRDVKPSNFVMGLDMYPDHRGVYRKRCYVIDFGLSRRYMTPEGEVREPRNQAGFRGTARYASLNAHESKELSRRDDFWSLLYLLVEFLFGQLPWRKEKDRDAVYRIKNTHTAPSLVHGLPAAMTQFYNHLVSLKYESVPDYELLERLMDTMYEEARVPKNAPYDWECVSSTIQQPHITLQPPPLPKSKPNVVPPRTPHPMASVAVRARHEDPRAQSPGQMADMMARMRIQAPPSPPFVPPPPPLMPPPPFSPSSPTSSHHPAAYSLTNPATTPHSATFHSPHPCLPQAPWGALPKSAGSPSSSSRHKVGGVMQRLQRGVRGLQERLLTGKSPTKSGSCQTLPMGSPSPGLSTSLTSMPRLERPDSPPGRINAASLHLLNRMHKAHDSKGLMEPENSATPVWEQHLDAACMPPGAAFGHTSPRHPKQIPVGLPFSQVSPRATLTNKFKARLQT